jgi:hypothetical protein
MECRLSLPKAIATQLLLATLLVASFFMATTETRIKFQIIGWIGMPVMIGAMIFFSIPLFRKGASLGY